MTLALCVAILALEFVYVLRFDYVFWFTHHSMKVSAIQKWVHANTVLFLCRCSRVNLRFAAALSRTYIGSSVAEL